MKNYLKTAICLLAAALLVVSTGCTTTSSTGQKVYDPVKTEQVKAAVEPVVTAVVFQVIRNSPQHSDQIASYFRSFGTVFVKMKASNTFTPEFLIEEADKATAKLQAGLPPEAVAGKNAVIALYKIFYADRTRAELSPEKWPLNVADVLIVSIDQALKDAGKPGLK